jgi:superfamily II DNA or RNA helicase
VSFSYPGWDEKAAAKARKRILGLLDDALAIDQKGSNFNPSVQQGLWDGRRHVFHRNEEDGTFPAGVTGRMKALLREDGYRVMRTRDERARPHDITELEISDDMLVGIILRDDQMRVIAAALEAGCGLLHVATGGGKTACSAAIIKALRKRCLFLVHTKQLLRQVREQLARFLGTIEEHIGVIGDGRFEPKHITVATVQSLTRVRGDAHKRVIAKYLKTIDVLILDECFPAGTMVGGKPIEDIRVGDEVPSFDGKCLIVKKVVRTFVSRPQVMVSVVAGGRGVVCTPGHPFLTMRGWVRALELSSSDVVLCTTDGVESVMRPVQLQAPGFGACEEAALHVHEMQIGAPRSSTPGRGECLLGMWGLGSDDREGGQGTVRSGSQGACILFGGTQASISVASVVGDDGSHQPQVCVRSDEDEEPDAEGIRSQEAEGDASRDGMEAGHPRRQRQTSPYSPADLGASPQVADGGGREDALSTSRLPELLQDRHCFGRTQSGDRSGWEESCSDLSTRTRREERRFLAWERVDSVEILERTSDGKFGGVCQDGLVYNLEVEDTHTYVADGFVVHNCHHSSSKSSFRLVQRIDAPWRYGMSGTPFGLADGKGLLVEAAFGPVVSRVTNEELIELGVNARPTIRMLEVSEPRLADGLSWQDVYKVGIVLNEARNRMVAREAAAFAARRHATLVLVRELWHGDKICELLAAAGVPHAFVHGQMPTDEVERQKHRLIEGKIMVLVASPIFGEGVDLPSSPGFPGVRGLIIADGGQSVANVLQKLGRGLRKKQGDNRVDVVDFADTMHRWLARHSQERMSMYEGEGFQVIA